MFALDFSMLAFNFFFLAISLCRGGYTYVTVFNCPPVGSHIPSSGRLCMPARSVCFRTPRLSLGHPGSFKSAHVFKCMRTRTAPLFNVPRGRRSFNIKGSLWSHNLSNKSVKSYWLSSYGKYSHSYLASILSDSQIHTKHTEALSCSHSQTKLVICF